MAWKKSLVSEERAQFVLAVNSESESFVSVCGRFGISRKTGYKWLQRYRRGGLKALADVSRRPHQRGKMHHIAWRMRLRKVRQEHPHWGAKKLRRLLQKAFPQARSLSSVSTLARWEPHPKRYCETISGRETFTIGSSWLASMKTVV